MNDDQTSSPEGYRVPAVEAWVKQHIEGLTPPFIWTKLEGGHSNLTYRLEDQKGNEAVIRRPPQGQLLPKAHDMGREWAAISSLENTQVPVPKALGFCQDITVTGALFYLMGFVPGNPLYTAEDTETWVPKSDRRKMAFSFIDALAALHAVDPDEIGLGNLGKRDSYVGRQLKTWYRSWQASVEPAKLDDPRAHELQAFFLDNLPDQGPIRLVHGDYGPHNVLIGPDCRVAAILDWEISTLGDPLADLAYALNPWPDPSDEHPKNPEAATAPEGFPSRSELADRYQQNTQCDLSALNYYVGFSWWKAAAILHGVYARYIEGKKSTEGVDLEAMKERLELSLTLSEQAVNRPGYRAK